ncbi:MAG: PQQ-dependent sugar dehydrogenase [Pseudomonadales bacterium]|nr:PQQ-dependent sugar dehydrogenase [Pseudomonadales bacterium]
MSTATLNADTAPGPASGQAVTTIEGADLRSAEAFIDAFYSWNPQRLQAAINAPGDATRLLYYQAWAEAGNYTIQTRRPCQPAADAGNAELAKITCAITVTDDLGGALGYVATDTFTLGLSAGEIRAVTFEGDDPEVFDEMLVWLADNRPEVFTGPCLGFFDGGTTPADCVRAIVQGARDYAALNESATPGVSSAASEQNEVLQSRLSDYADLYQVQCAVCHGDRLQGEAQGTPLVGVDLIHGDSIDALILSISKGFPLKGMPEWAQSLSESQIKSLALYISETRSGFSYTDFNYDTAFTVPAGVIESERHAFTLEMVISGLDPLPFSIAPLPDGRILLTEKKRGLSIISTSGEQSPLIEGAPKAYDDTYTIAIKQEWGYGWMLDVATHPDYLDNGWIYLLYGDRCSDCNDIGRAAGTPVSMNKLIRGRIADGEWLDEEVIWQSPIQYYGSVPDIGAGGRISFDGHGHVFFSVGVKGIDNHTGIQDLATPWGKIHRVNDDGTIPLDNPFMDTPGAMKSIWSYGHRSPQGLEYRQATGELWGTEMGPRGGDEVNRLLPGHNYGWPLTSRGLNYDGSPVDYGKDLGIEFDLRDIDQPVVDLSPSPAVSSFIFYAGNRFPGWQGDLIVGSLKGRTLYRMEIEDNTVVHTEPLLKDLVRFRDIEVGADGLIYLLLEHNSGGQIVRMVPSPTLLSGQSPPDTGT